MKRFFTPFIIWLKKIYIHLGYQFYYSHKMNLYPDYNSKWMLVKGYRQSVIDSRKNENQVEDYPVDFVVTWLDSSDPKWQEERNRYKNDGSALQTRFNPTARYREWETFEYWFRGVEQNAPWVRNVFLITCGHVPEWLNLKHPKLKIVRHSDYIPARYLPTFSSRPIELNMWRIEELSEHFVYFNDDVFLNTPVKKEDFFCNGLPKIYAAAKPVRMGKNPTSFDFALYNDIGQINDYRPLFSVMEEHPEKWFSYKTERAFELNVRAYLDGYLSGYAYTHLCFPFRKSSMKACAEEFSEAFEFTSANRFRTNGDINLLIFQLWEMVNNTFEPVGSRRYFGYWINVNRETLEKLEDKMFDPSVKSVCINDHNGIDGDFYQIRDAVLELFKKKYPEKSSYEL